MPADEFGLRMLRLIPPFGGQGALQTFAFWLLFALVPLFSLTASLGVRAAMRGRYAAAILCFPLLKDTTYHRLWTESRIRRRGNSYILPLTFMFLLNAFMCIVLVSGSLAGDGLVDTAHHMMLCGPRCADTYAGSPPEELLAFRRYQTLTLVTMGYAFLGWVCWSLVTIFDRAASLQILPTTFHTMTIRLVLAVLVAIALRHVTMAETGVASAAIIVVGFGTGMFPQRGLAFLQDQFSRLLRARQRSEEFGLELLQGISAAVAFRLHEIGVEDAIDLGHANPFVLFDASGYDMSEILDWIGQAQLLAIVQMDQFRILQDAGIRTIYDAVLVLEAEDGLGLPAGLLPELLKAGLSLPVILAQAAYQRLAQVQRAIALAEYGATLPAARTPEPGQPLPAGVPELA